MNMFACTPFNEQKKEQSLLSISTWSVFGKQNVQAKKVFSNKSVYILSDFKIDLLLAVGNLKFWPRFPSFFASFTYANQWQTYPCL